MRTETIEAPAAMRIYLVRHGETEYNRRMIVQGRRINSELNETGLAQAERLAERMADVPLDAIYSSTLRRAIQTAESIGQFHPGVPLIQNRDLEEMSWGIYEGRKLTPDVVHAFREMRQRWDEGRFDVPVEGGESILQVEQRARRIFSEIVTRHERQTVLIVSHGRFLRVLLGSILAGFGLARMQEIQHTNTAVNLIECVEGRFEPALLNCTAHLMDAA